MIYFLKNHDLKLIKIGMSDYPYRRLKQIKSSSPERYRFSMLHVIPGGPKLEHDLHEIYKPFQTHGEWYKVNPKIEEFIIEEQKEEIVFCRICGGKHLSSPDEEDINQHNKNHIQIRRGAFPYETREILKRIAWQYLADKEMPVSTSSFIENHDSALRLIAYSWWMREIQMNSKMPHLYFDDYIMDFFELIDARESGNVDRIKKIEEKRKQHWKTGKYQTYN